jgi:hypothetical protein
MTTGEDTGRRFETQITFLRGKLGKDGAYLCVLAGLAVFTFSLFLSWTEAKTSTALEDQGYTTGWSELGFFCLIPLSYVFFCIVDDRKISPRAVIIAALAAFIILTITNVVYRGEWITREYTTNYLNYGGSYRSFSGRSHSSGSDLGAGFWLGAFSLLSISVAALTWSLHKVLERPAVIPPSPDLEPLIDPSPSYVEPKETQQTTSFNEEVAKTVPNISIRVPKVEYSTFDRLNELARLKDRGLMTSEEFQIQKALMLTPERIGVKSRKKVLFILGAVMLLSVAAIYLSWSYSRGIYDPVEDAASENMQEPVAASAPPAVDANLDQTQALVPNPQPTEPSISADASNVAESYKVGECRSTVIASIAFRLDGEPDSGSTVTYANEIYGVSYQSVPEVVNSQIGDQVSLCLESVPDDCPAGDDRGKIYRTTNLRTGESWSLPDSQHSCGGA